MRVVRYRNTVHHNTIYGARTTGCAGVGAVDSAYTFTNSRNTCQNLDHFIQWLPCTVCYNSFSTSLSCTERIEHSLELTLSGLPSTYSRPRNVSNHTLHIYQAR
jgi:hypothetical protein